MFRSKHKHILILATMKMVSPLKGDRLIVMFYY
jgi:hypothetical protein